ncbi:MAG TPA: zinc ribbon domain-containing protein [Bacteroidetes bacterium]|nr:zinc ribbon domain-containing protein [Bacteroidota bacterium]
MDCSWWGPGYRIGWFWTGQIFWLLLLAAIGFLVFLAVRSNRRRSGENSGAGFSARPITQGKCPKCGEPVEDAYLCCPECHYRLKVNCPSCGKLVKTSWAICPYCENSLSKITKANTIN